MIKFVVFALLVGTCVATPLKPQHVKFFGKLLSSNAVSKPYFRYIGSEQVIKAGKPFRENTAIFTFPENPLNDGFIINSIQQIDFTKDPAQVEIIDGGIGSSSVTIAVKTDRNRDLDTEFRFYGENFPSSKPSSKSSTIVETLNEFLFGKIEGEKLDKISKY